MNIIVVETGYIAWGTGVCFAEKGINETYIDLNKEKADTLNQGKISIYVARLQTIAHQPFSSINRKEIKGQTRDNEAYDGRNILERESILSVGVCYFSIGK